EDHDPHLAARNEIVLLAVEVVRWLVFGFALNALVPESAPRDPAKQRRTPLHHAQQATATEPTA
ncbi:MAG: hypothetical protein ACYDAR_07845, partial [Thermomicrobiales bacterium]